MRNILVIVCALILYTSSLTYLRLSLDIRKTKKATFRQAVCGVKINPNYKALINFRAKRKICIMRIVAHAGFKLLFTPEKISPFCPRYLNIFDGPDLNSNNITYKCSNKSIITFDRVAVLKYLMNNETNAMLHFTILLNNRTCPNKPKNGWYQCYNSTKCLMENVRCDGIMQCDDNSDETFHHVNQGWANYDQDSARIIFFIQFYIFNLRQIVEKYYFMETS
ncbi:hypothetical protein A3Q56_03562 [Intoshia linei]|uniref:CUB domain-containing protein n=1 Tax=Intoshia linei TaxID=1819745 RepID=A0A177B3G1_9BILA|nr:hypothetical protein A3Q56_03562 [Intoshia linei]